MTDFAEDFESGLGAWSTGGTDPSQLATDTAHFWDGSHALKVLATDQDGYLRNASLTGLGVQDQWLQVAFRIWVNNWSEIWGSGDEFSPGVLSFEDGLGLGLISMWIQATSSATGNLYWQSVSQGSLIAGQWNYIEFNQKYGSDGKVYAHTYVNGADAGELNVFGSSTPTALLLGQPGFGTGSTAGVTYWLDTIGYTHNATPGTTSGSGGGDGGGPGAGASAMGRVWIAFDANMLDANPTWTLIDTLRDSLVARIEVRDGRQTEQDETETGTCTIYLNDTTGLFDPNNLSSPYFGLLDSKPIKVELFNPVTATLVPQWRGTIDDIQTVLHPATMDGVSILANVQIECVDIFDYLARAEMQIGVSGNYLGTAGATPAGSEMAIFYEDGPVANPGGPPGRIEQLLIDAGLDVDMFVVFSGNVDVLESLYDPGDEFLTALKDAVDAELPGLANQYVDKLGRYVFHGRFARLDPDTVAAGAGAAWDFNRWKAGDGAAITGDSDNAQIREFAMGRPREMIVNSATCYPENIKDTDMAGQIVIDFTSQDEHGIHGRSDVNLITKGHKTNGDTGNQQCLKYAQFWINEYAFPRQRIDTIVFKSVAPSDPRAASTWGLITGVSISDIVNVNVGYPGGTGIQNKDFYVEGRQMTIEPLQPGYDMVTLELNMSPAVTDTGGVFD